MLGITIPNTASLWVTRRVRLFFLVCTAICGGGALWSALSCLCCFGRSATLDVSYWLGSGYSPGLTTPIGRNVCLSYQTIRESTQASSGHSLYHCPELVLSSLVSSTLTKNMLAAINEPSMLLNHPTRCTSPLLSSVLLAISLSTWDPSSVHPPSVSEPVAFHLLDSIPTTSWSSKAVQLVLAVALQP